MKVSIEAMNSLEGFSKEKDKFYLLSYIATSEGSILYSDYNSYIMGRSEENFPIWIWSKEDIDQASYNKLKKDLNELMNIGDNKITCKKELYDKITKEYNTKDYFEMAYLTCEKLIKPKDVKGVFARPNYKDKITLAKYFQSARKESKNEDLSLNEALEEVELWIKGQRIYTLLDSSGKVVSTAAYSILGETAKITHVFTPIEERCKGYCTNLIYELTKKIEDDGLKPILYTDYNYEPSNKAYKNVGYENQGILINFKIEKRKDDNMERLFFEEPTLARKEDAIDYINEFIRYNSEINGTGGLHNYLPNYEGWLSKLEEDKTRIPDEERVPALTYFLVRESDNKIVGMSNIRLVLNKKLRESCGHIGYGIRPEERLKGYNKVNLYLDLEVCDKHGIEEAILSCDKSNAGSRKTMEALGAKLVREIPEENDVEQVFTINVKEALEKYSDKYASNGIKR